jgi:hypothetical protein
VQDDDGNHINIHSLCSRLSGQTKCSNDRPARVRQRLQPDKLEEHLRSIQRVPLKGIIDLTDDSTGGRTAMEETIDISADNPTMMEESETEPAMEQSESEYSASEKELEASLAKVGS